MASTQVPHTHTHSVSAGESPAQKTTWSFKFSTKREAEREKTSKNRQGVERNKMGKSIEQNVCVCVCHVNWRKPHATRKYFFERGRRRQHDVDKARDSDCAATAANRLAQAAAK